MGLHSWPLQQQAQEQIFIASLHYEEPALYFWGHKRKEGASISCPWGKADHLFEEIGAWTNSSRMSIQEGLRPLVGSEGAGLGTQVVLFAQNLPETSTVHDKIKGEYGGGVGY